jgi:hypothetical protein
MTRLKYVPYSFTAFKDDGTNRPMGSFDSANVSLMMTYKVELSEKAADVARFLGKARNDKV